MKETSNDIIHICNTTAIEIAGMELELLLPDLEKVRKNYFSMKQSAFPFWAMLWPSAKALGAFIVDNKELLKNKTVLEIGAGLGLPSLVAAKFAREVICTDLFPEGLIIAKKNAELNGIQHLHTRVFDWNSEDVPDAELIIGSDISYDPLQFQQLEKQISAWLSNGKTIILSMPQRLQTVPFVQAIESYIRQRREFEMEEEGRKVFVSVFVLR